MAGNEKKSSGVLVVRKDHDRLRWVSDRILDVFGVDLRSLAAFRILLALLVLATLAVRLTDLSAHYTDSGILPRAPLIEEELSRWQFSLTLINGEPFFQASLFGVTVLAALCLLVGYRTRVMTVIVWVLLLSIHFRNPMLNSGGDVFLRLLLFWSMFLPLGAYWSMDCKLGISPTRLSKRFLSVGTVALFMQIAFMYWFTAILKSGREWRMDGTALYYTLSIDRYTSPFGEYLLHFPKVLEVLTFATILLEAFGPFLLFCPFLIGPIRTGTVLAFMSLHLGIWLTMDIGLFPWISVFCMVCFLPGWFWDKVGTIHYMIPGLFNRAQRLRHAAAQLIGAYGSNLRARLVSILGPRQPSIAGSGLQATDDRPQSRAALQSPPPGTAPGATNVAQGETGRGLTAEPKPITLRSSPITNLLALFFLIYVFCWNLTTVSSFTIPERLEPIGYSFGLAQKWNMFAPAPDKDDYRFVIPGTLRDGKQVDLMRVTYGDFGPRAVSWEKPDNVASTYKNSHWLKYLDSLWYETYSTDGETKRQYFSSYVCREWNARHAGSEQLMTLQIASMWQETLPYNRHTTPQKEILWEHRCF